MEGICEASIVVVFFSTPLDFGVEAGRESDVAVEEEEEKEDDDVCPVDPAEGEVIGPVERCPAWRHRRTRRERVTE